MASTLRSEEEGRRPGQSLLVEGGALGVDTGEVAEPGSRLPAFWVGVSLLLVLGLGSVVLAVTQFWAGPTPSPATVASPTPALKVLFVGNSFTYGPAPFAREDQLQLNNLPRIFKFVAESLGNPVHQQEDTVGGCTLAAHLPSCNADGQNCSGEDASCTTVSNARVNASEGCTVLKGVKTSDRYSPCPQRMTRQAYGPWDVVVLQDFSSLPTIKKARELMLEPAFREYAEVLRRQGAMVPREEFKFGGPKVASFMTWPYYNGTMSSCPGGTRKACWPHGGAADLSGCKSDNGAWKAKVVSVPCQTYALARGSADMLNHGADVVVPAGLAWAAARGVAEIPAECKTSIDAEYSTPDALQDLELPLTASAADVLWAGEPGMELYTDKGPDYNSKYCNDCTIDHHASALGVYLNACVFYATLFGASPVGAAVPDGEIAVDGMILPAIDPSKAEAMQRVAHRVVLGDDTANDARLGTWWKSAAASQ